MMRKNKIKKTQTTIPDINMNTCTHRNKLILYMGNVVKKRWSISILIFAIDTTTTVQI